MSGRNVEHVVGLRTAILRAISGTSRHDDRDDAEAAKADLVSITKFASTFESNGIFVMKGAVRRTEVV